MAGLRVIAVPVRPVSASIMAAGHWPNLGQAFGIGGQRSDIGTETGKPGSSLSWSAMRQRVPGRRHQRR